MNFNFNFNYNQLNQKSQESNECISRGVCSVSPSLSYLQEVILSYFKELVFYLIKLREYGITNDKIKDTVLSVLSTLIIGVNYEESQFFKLVTTLYNDVLQAKELYISICEKNNITPCYPSSVYKKAPKRCLSDAIRLGQKLYTKKIEKYSIEQKNLYDLIFNIAKSVCISMTELEELGISNDEPYNVLLNISNLQNYKADILEDLFPIIKKIIDLDHELSIKLHEAKIERYGEIIPTQVPVIVKENKAILVSGSNLRDLELLLEATKDRGIDVYTHGHLIIAHAFPKFRKYTHMVSHYGSGSETYLFDFTSFPGAIFMTKHSMQRVDSLYRSRIFTTDTIAPKGVMIIKDYNFEPLISSALSAKGFRKFQDKGVVKVGLDEKNVTNKIIEISEKVKKGEIKKFVILGHSDNTSKLQKDYFEGFLKLLPEDCFLLSMSTFSHASIENENILQVESDYGLPAIYKALDIVTEKNKIRELIPSIFFTKCELNTLLNAIYFNQIGTKDIYFPECSPNLFNPSFINTVRDNFGLKQLTNPEADWKEILEN